MCKLLNKNVIQIIFAHLGCLHLFGCYTPGPPLERDKRGKGERCEGTEEMNAPAKTFIQ